MDAVIRGTYASEYGNHPETIARSGPASYQYPAGRLQDIEPVICSSRSAVVSAGGRPGGHSAVMHGPERRLVPAARLDELPGCAAAVGVSVGHGAAQLIDEWRLPPGPFGPLAFAAVQVVFGGLAGGEEQPAGRPRAVTGNWDHAGRVSVAAPVFPVRALLPRVPVLCEYCRPRKRLGEPAGQDGYVR
jgi:hypothetical protein